MRTVTPAPAGPPPGAPRLTGAVSLSFAADSVTARDPDLRVYARDLALPYGLPLAEDRLAAGSGHSYAEMGEAVIDALVPAGQPVDLLVEVFASPDVQPGRAASVHLSSYCPGRPFAFALAEQGTAGAFSALALTASYLSGDGFERALVLVLEQAALPWQPPLGTPVPDRHTAVGLLWERSGGPALTPLDGCPRLPPHRARARVAAALAAETGRGGPLPLLLLGPGLAGWEPPPGTEALRARAGSPYTGLWSLLAEYRHRIGGEGRPALLAEYDPLLGHLDLARLAPD